VQDERWELLSPRARRARLHDALSTLDVIARLGHERGCLREHTAYVYPTSVGEWLAHAVQLAGGATWQAPFIPLLLPDAHEAGYPPLHIHRTVTRAQGADSVLTFGAAVWSALLEVRDAWHDDEQQATAQRRVIDRAGDVLDEVRAESDGLRRRQTTHRHPPRPNGCPRGHTRRTSAARPGEAGRRKRAELRLASPHMQGCGPG